MREEDLPACLDLCRAAGWNQLERDWRLLLRLAPKTTMCAESEGRVIGSVALLDYGSGFAWISMVLVHPQFRGRRIGFGLFAMAMELGGGIPCLRLDATAEGRTIYRKFGFEDEFEIVRFEGEGQCDAPEPNYECDWTAICETDRLVFGANRESILKASHCHGAADGSVALSRPGYLARHIGPIAANDPDTAAKLLRQAVSTTTGRMYVDVPHHARSIVPPSFQSARMLVRMSRGKNPSPGIPERQFAILGPEFG